MGSQLRRSCSLGSRLELKIDRGISMKPPSTSVFRLRSSLRARHFFCFSFPPKANRSTLRKPNSNGRSGETEYESNRLTRHAAPPLESATARMGFGFAASDATAVAGESRQSRAADGRKVRSGVLSVSRKCARRGISESCVYRDVCLRKRLPRDAAECCAERVGRGGFDRRASGTGDLPRGVLFTASRFDDTAHAAGGSAAGCRGVDAATPGTGRRALGEACANFRESRRADGREQPTSALPNLGEWRSAEHPCA